MKRYTVKIYDKKKNKLFSFNTIHKKRFVSRIKNFNWKKGFVGYLKVYYGRFEDVWGDIIPFDNEGWYDTKRDLLAMYRCFDEITSEELELGYV